MDKETRIKYFDDLTSAPNSAYGSMEVWYKNRRQKLDVYEIDLEYLLYNPYNGRIASLVKSYEKQNGRTLDPSDQEDKKMIEGFLWESNISSNKTTKQSLKDHKQLKYGIVTKDGVIIDGNRRAILLNEIYREDNENPRYYLGVVLNETLEENAK